MHDKSNSDKPPTFLAKLHKAGDESQRQVVVKFVYNYSGTYGATVHQYLYDLGLAPHLYCAENLHRGLVMVVMEHLSFEEGTGGWVELDTFEGKLDAMADVVRTKLENIIELLQRRKMVHADLRPRNIMVKVDGSRDIILHENQPLLYVVDFDWAGMVGEARYPPFLNPKVPWPTRTEAYREVGEDDDKILLDNWWGAFVKGQPAI
ncbi:hypothetical protein CPB86DRAFT_700905 [Serendipita vermifera]|nr:hypothetical protein CPB86DRAFT_700905 [Serendipita vermifera]